MLKLTGFDAVDIRGPRAPLGAFANVLPFLADPIPKLMKLEREYGDLVALADRNPAMVVAFGAAHNHALLTNVEVFHHSSELPFPSPEGSALDTFTSTLMFANGESLRRQRRLLMPAFQKASLASYAETIVALTAAALDRWPVDGVADIGALLRELTLEIALRCIFGVEPGPASDALAKDMHVMQTLALSPMTALLPLRVPGLPYRRLYDAAEAMARGLAALIEHKRTHASARHDVLGLTIEARDEDGSQLSERELLGIIHALFSAAFDTSSSTLSTALLLLSLHPEVLEEIVAEIDAKLGTEPPTPAAVAELERLEHALLESARLLPAVPILFFRELSREARVGAHTLPAGANLILSPFATHRDPGLYPEPARYRPDRWRDLRPSPYEYMPFGAGPRTCLGMGFANMTVRLVLVSILQRHQLALAPGGKVDRAFRGLIFDYARGVKMVVRPREAPAPARVPLRGSLREIIELPS